MNRTTFSAVELGKRLRQLRLRAGLTQAKLGERMGIAALSRAWSVCRLEQGIGSRPSLHAVMRFLHACRATLADIADVLGEGPESLGSGSQPQSREPVGSGSRFCPTCGQLLPGSRQLRVQRERQRRRRDRETIRRLQNAVLPLVLPYCTGRHEFKSGAYLGAVEAFYHAWKQARRRARGEDPSALIQAGFDRVEKIGLDDGLNPTALRLVRERVAAELKSSQD